MLTLYTAVGSLQFVNVNGKPVPHVINNQKEYGMSKEELLVWSCLAFQILTYPELECLFEKNCADSGQSISLPLYLSVPGALHPALLPAPGQSAGPA